MYNDFVEIDEKSTPYYQFVHQQNVLNQDPVLNQGSIVDNQPCVLVDEPKGKNSIFDMDHSISKPVTKMTADEIEDLKSGITPISTLKKHASISSLKARENKSIFVPVSSTTYAARAPAATPLPPLPTPNPRTAFLQRESVTTMPDLDINDFRARKDNVELVNYLPIRKNLLGYGQFSQVYSGTFITKKSTIERPCAVKKLNLSGEAQLLGLREVKMLSQISHTSVITLIDAWDESGTDKSQVWKLAEAVENCETNLAPGFQLCVALEYCANGSMWDWIQQYPDALSCKLFVKWSKQILAGLQEIHTRGIIHHDIKPHNVLLTELLDIRICDFGNAMFVPESRMVQPGGAITPGSELSAGSQSLTNGAGLGTLAYTAPEMFNSSESYSFSVDIYALGVLLFTIISGNQPFKRLKSNVQIILAIKRGFFNANNQSLVPKWKYPDPSEGHWQFPNGEHVPQFYVDLIRSMANTDQRERPVASKALSLVIAEEETCE